MSSGAGRPSLAIPQLSFLNEEQTGPRRRWNAGRGPDHEEEMLPMAEHDHTHRGRTASLDLSVQQSTFLRRLAASAHDGLSADLRTYPDQIVDPDLAGRELEAYVRLLEGLRIGFVSADRAVLAASGRLAKMIDTSNEYRRVIWEHRAGRRLVGSIGSALGEGS